MENILDLKDSENYDKLDKVATVIKNGGIVVFPTETVYGIGADCLNEEAIKKLYRVKNRPITQKTSLLVSSIYMLKQYTKNISEIENILINSFFPGPLTLVLHKNKSIPYLLTNNEEIVGFRMPKNGIALKLIEKVGRPIATSSANTKGHPSGICIEDIIQDFGEKVDYYIDGGKSKIGKGSTVAQVMEDGSINIIREGSITLEQMMQAINNKNNLYER